MSIITETNYFGNFRHIEDPKVLIIPVPYEYTASSNKGTKYGPQGILNASTHLESFDDELWTEIEKIGINTTNFVSCEFVNNKTKQPFVEVEDAVRNAIISGCLPILIGGEHSLSYGAIKAVYDLYPDISVVHFGAHLDLKESLQGNKYTNKCTIKQIYNLMPDLKIVQVGTRLVSLEEKNWLEENNPNIDIFFAKDKNRWTVADLLTNLTKNVYVSFNLNFLDTSIMPSVQRPEPGGLSWNQAIDIMKNICTFKEIVGMDFVEFTPIPDLLAPNILAAKIIYKSIGYTFARQLGVLEEENSFVSTEN
ncbi:MAG: agmatinase family protein [Candidatus Melainabacteria bacterium]|nr:agmatinase family protein [Candidatus Melainabacteria bacterium]